MDSKDKQSSAYGKENKTPRQNVRDVAEARRRALEEYKAAKRMKKQEPQVQRSKAIVKKPAIKPTAVINLSQPDIPNGIKPAQSSPLIQESWEETQAKEAVDDGSHCAFESPLHTAMIEPTTIQAKDDQETASDSTEAWKVLIAGLVERLRQHRESRAVALLSKKTPHKRSVCSLSDMSTPPEMNLSATIPLDYQNQMELLEDEETSRLREEIEEVIQRTPQIRRMTPPDRRNLIEAVATAIKQTGSNSCHQNSPLRKAHKAVDDLREKEGEPMCGSAYLYAMVTPGKRLREILQTDQAISPVRRSTRLLHHASSPRQTVYKSLDEVEHLESVGYVPNPALLSSQPKSRKTDQRGDNRKNPNV